MHIFSIDGNDSCHNQTLECVYALFEHYRARVSANNIVYNKFCYICPIWSLTTLCNAHVH